MDKLLDPAIWHYSSGEIYQSNTLQSQLPDDSTRTLELRLPNPDAVTSIDLGDVSVIAGEITTGQLGRLSALTEFVATTENLSALAITSMIDLLPPALEIIELAGTDSLLSVRSTKPLATGLKLIDIRRTLHGCQDVAAIIDYIYQFRSVWTADNPILLIDRCDFSTETIAQINDLTNDLYSTGFQKWRILNEPPSTTVIEWGVAISPTADWVLIADIVSDWTLQADYGDTVEKAVQWNAGIEPTADWILETEPVSDWTLDAEITTEWTIDNELLENLPSG